VSGAARPGGRRAGHFGGYEEKGTGRQLPQRRQRWRPKGDAQRVKGHDFEDKTLGKAAPFSVYDIAADADWISLGITCDTGEFAAASYRTWLERIGRARYPKAGELRSQPLEAAKTTVEASRMHCLAQYLAYGEICEGWAKARRTRSRPRTSPSGFGGNGR
jgi:hypothetical protein